MPSKSDPMTKEHTDEKVKTETKTLMSELSSYGLAANMLEKYDASQLEDIAKGARWLRRTHEDAAKLEAEDVDDDNENDDTHSASEHIELVDNSNGGANDTRYSFTEVDRKVLRMLISSSGRVSSLALSRKLEIPLTTIQRRRKRLESEFLEVAYTLRLDKLGWRKADLLVSTYKGKTAYVGKELLSHNAITRVCRSIGEHTIDLHAEVVFKNNTELLNMIEWIKSQDGVKDVIWTEPVEVVGKNTAIQYEAIDKHK